MGKLILIFSVRLNWILSASVIVLCYYKCINRYIVSTMFIHSKKFVYKCYIVNRMVFYDIH